MGRNFCQSKGLIGAVCMKIEDQRSRSLDDQIWAKMQFWSHMHIQRKFLKASVSVWLRHTESTCKRSHPIDALSSNFHVDYNALLSILGHLYAVNTAALILFLPLFLQPRGFLHHYWPAWGHSPVQVLCRRTVGVWCQWGRFTIPNIILHPLKYQKIITI